MPSRITNVSLAPITIPEPYVVILAAGQAVTVSDEPNVAITKLGGAARINGLLEVSLVSQVDSGIGALPDEAGKYAKKAGDDFTGMVTGLMGVRVGTSTTKPTASEALRGLIWVVRNGPGVADGLQIVVKNGADIYTWRAI